MILYVVLGLDKRDSKKKWYQKRNNAMLGFLPVFVDRLSAWEYAKETNLPVLKLDTDAENEIRL